jgi:hypothetical protein
MHVATLRWARTRNEPLQGKNRTIALWLGPFSLIGGAHWTAQIFVDTHEPLCA